MVPCRRLPEQIVETFGRRICSSGVSMCSRILAERLDKAARLAAEAGEEWAWNWRGAAVVTHAISPRVTYTSAEEITQKGREPK